MAFLKFNNICKSAFTRGPPAYLIKCTGFPPDACVPGYCVWQTLRRKGFRPTRMIIFTTLELPLEDILEMYFLRWNVEDTLRDIKTTIKMDFIHAKSPDIAYRRLGH